MATIRTLFWFTVFIAFTFAFTVLFEHGFTNFDTFKTNSKKEYDYLSQMFSAKPAKKADESEKIGGGIK